MSESYQVPSSDGQRTYTVTNKDGSWSCSCLGWTRHMPRRDCKHIIGLTGAKPKPQIVAINGNGMSAKRAVKELGISPDDATAIARAKREETQAKKDVKLGKLRYGFQLAHTYEAADLLHGQWVAEIKYDGELGMLIDGHIINRSGNDVTHRFPEIEKVSDAVFVGEVVILDANGISHFNKIQERNTDDPIKIMAASRLNPAKFMAFDMLEDIGHQDITKEPLSQRRARMEFYFGHHKLQNIILAEQIPIGNSDYQVQTLVDTCRKMETEGIMLKNLDSPYIAKRGRNWVKAKTWQEAEFDVMRFEDTGIGDGFVIIIMSGTHEQRVVCNSHKMKQAIKAGHKRVEIKFLTVGEDGALRFPSLRRLI